MPSEFQEEQRERAVEQAEIARRMQYKILKHLEERLDNGNITATELKTAVDLLKDNGWSFNEADLPKELREELTKQIKYDEPDYGDITF